MTLHGPDLSSFQAALDLTRTPHDFAIVKATQGNWYVNPAFGTHMGQAKGGLRGAYHFWETGTSAAAQVDAFLAVVGPYLDGKTLIALDYEPGYNNDLPGASQWLSMVEQRTGLCPILYLNHYYAGLPWPPEVKGCPMWLAGAPDGVYYPNALPSGVPSVPGWTVIAQQWTDRGTLDGYPSTLDLNVWFGDETTWIKQATKAGAAPVTTQTGDWFDMATKDDLKAVLEDVIQNSPLVQIGTDPNTKKPVDWSPAHVLTNLRGGNSATQTMIGKLANVVEALAKKSGVDTAEIQADLDAIRADLEQPATNGGTAPSAA